MPYLFPHATLELLIALLVSLALEGYLGSISGVWHKYPRIGKLAQSLATQAALKLDKDTAGDGARAFRGVVVVGTLVGGAGLVGMAAQVLAQDSGLLWFAIVLVIIGGLGQRAAYAPLDLMRVALEKGDLQAARRAVDTVTDQDIHGLDQTNVIKAAIEGATTAHVRSVAVPVLAGLVFGVGGIFAAFVAMAIGASLPRVSSPAFAGPARRLMRFLMWLGSPVTAIFLTIAAIGVPHGNPLNALKASLPGTSGLGPEGRALGAAAGALGIKLGGPKIFAERVVARPWILSDKISPTEHDLSRYMTLYGLQALVSGGLLAICIAGLYQFSLT